MRQADNDRVAKQAARRRLNAIAKKFGLEADRVLRALAGAQSHSHLSADELAEELDGILGDHSESVPLESLLAAFETEDLDKLYARDPLLEREELFITVADLERILEDYLGILGSQTDNIVKMGRPASLKRRERFLDRQVLTLYQTEGVRKCLGCCEVSPPCPEDRVSFFDWFHRNVYPEDQKLYEIDPEADIPDLTLEDIERLEASRLRLLAAKKQILQRALVAAQVQSVEGFWDRCVEILVHNVGADDMVFLLRVDRFLLGYDSKLERRLLPLSHAADGGISDIFWLVYYVESKISVSPIYRDSRLLGNIIRTDSDGRPVPTSGSYFGLLAATDRGTVNEALEKLQDAEKEREAMWWGFRQRANIALADRLTKGAQSALLALPTAEAHLASASAKGAPANEIVFLKSSSGWYCYGKKIGFKRRGYDKCFTVLLSNVGKWLDLSVLADKAGVSEKTAKSAISEIRDILTTARDDMSRRDQTGESRRQAQLYVRRTILIGGKKEGDRYRMNLGGDPERGYFVPSE